ncbi:MAG: hypothetical protein GOVbin1709_47 [Prokaryotic dsDNA virus sp.]|nr:MAG: hypothetical protein GOVbin1709_47 [Prokaryotic dsDNA virus sp.]|tara:strand:+ start:3415 stop:3624 length:210 start_codon:yes stop_codon:yes gene_type:complete
MAKMKLVSILVEKEKSLREAYEAAIEDEQVRFHFEGAMYYTTYAKHLLDYINDYKKLLKNEQNNTTENL